MLGQDRAGNGASRRLAACGAGGAALVVAFGAPGVALAGSSGHTATFGGSSTDGSRVFFNTTEPLVRSDSDNRVDVYRRAAGVTTRVSRGEINGNGPSGSFFEGASADGSHVFFRTVERLVVGDTDSTTDLYERSGGVTRLVSAGAFESGFVPAFLAASADGSRVFFQREDGSGDIYERAGGVTTVVSVGEEGQAISIGAGFGGASADGAHVFFSTRDQLIAADGDSSGDVYERFGGLTRLVSAGEINGNDEFLEAFFGGASADGSRVFFGTAEQLVEADTDAAFDVYQRAGGETTLVSAGEINGNGNFPAGFAGASADGTRVFFQTDEQLVGSDHDFQTDVYQRSGGVTTLVSEGEVDDPDTFDPVAFFRGASIDGSRVFFITAEPLVSSDKFDAVDVYERSGGITTLVSAGEGAHKSHFGAEFKGGSADGARVYFETEDQLTDADTDAGKDLYLRSGGTTTLISQGHDAGLPAPTYGGHSADGTRVFFHTDATLASTDLDTDRDIYERAGSVYSLVSGETVPPQTWVARPRGRDSDRTPSMVIHSSEPIAGVRCRLDGRSIDCKARDTLRRLRYGRHVLRARAIDVAGNIDPSPARRAFSVVR